MVYLAQISGAFRCPWKEVPAATRYDEMGKLMNEWRMQDAKNRFSVIVDAEITGDPERVIQHGKPAVVVPAAEEYERLLQLEEAKVTRFDELLLAIRQDDGSVPGCGVSW